MRLTQQEQASLAHLLGLMLDADQPKTLLACLRHVAERKAWSVTRGKVDRDEASEWSCLAEALRGVEDRLKDAA